MRITFETFEDYNAAKALNSPTITGEGFDAIVTPAAIQSFTFGEPIYETVDGLLTGRFIIDHAFTPEQLAELAANGLQPDVEINNEIV